MTTFSDVTRAPHDVLYFPCKFLHGIRGHPEFLNSLLMLKKKILCENFLQLLF
ncbi:unnamed protein product [Larinioides sclopetarius]|uniref:Uncharacterized protein n=1 Tax=Larinioides sclopetarius TaxID=280406 RepID=A0AAV2BU36_9ARAC